MAGGEGGFSTKAMGFDKKEVNDYIANLNQRIKEIQVEKKDNDEKLQKALRKAQDADAKIKKAKEESQSKITELELELSAERKNQEKLINQIDELNRKLKNSGRVSGSNSGTDEKRSAEIIAKANAEAKAIIDKANATAKATVDKANTTAKDTVEKAKATAQQLINDSKGAGGGAVNIDGLDELIDLIGGFVNNLTNEAGEIKQKAAKLNNSQSENRVTVPDLSAVSAPVAAAPVAEAPKAEHAMSPGNLSSGLSFDAFGESDDSVSSDDLFSMLEEDSSSSDDGDMEMISEVLPIDDFAPAPSAGFVDELTETDDTDFDFGVTEVTENNTTNENRPVVNSDFESQILAQNFTSSSLAEQVDEDMLAAVKQQEEKYAVKPSSDGIIDFDMDMSAEEEDPLAAMLKQAEQLFGGASASEEPKQTEDTEPKSSSSASDDASNPWAALQNELLAMEKSGGLESNDDDFYNGQTSSSSDPKVPNTDDSAIWDFGDESRDSDSDSEDDMGMSSDLFGNL